MLEKGLGRQIEDKFISNLLGPVKNYLTFISHNVFNLERIKYETNIVQIHILKLNKDSVRIIRVIDYDS